MGTTLFSALGHVIAGLHFGLGSHVMAVVIVLIVIVVTYGHATRRQRDGQSEEK
jgi:uncharacterized membrane protein